ncbi:MAG TPA: magnesium chelatase domain-containing protein [Tepidiformaceae bacterium]|nr:magnesium chelatase domain-containing protein [Tepidiformaceae bacterium]
MLAKVLSCAVIGLDGELVDVEIDISRGEPKLTVVGLPDAAIQESKDRVRSAIRNSALTWPFNSRIVVNLAPAGFAERKSRDANAAAARTQRGV